MNLTIEAQRQLRITELAKAAQVCGITKRNSLPNEVRGLIANADTSKQPLNIDELKKVCVSCNTSEHAVSLLIAETINVTDAARRKLLDQQPNLILPGGELYPEKRAEACWRDCQQFLRVVIYGVACDCAEITDTAGMAALRLLYKEMKVPVPAMMYALAQMRKLTTLILEASGHLREIDCLNRAFDNLVNALQPSDSLMPKADQTQRPIAEAS